MSKHEELRRRLDALDGRNDSGEEMTITFDMPADPETDFGSTTMQHPEHDGGRDPERCELCFAEMNPPFAFKVRRG